MFENRAPDLVNLSRIMQRNVQDFISITK